MTAPKVMDTIPRLPPDDWSCKWWKSCKQASEDDRRDFSGFRKNVLNSGYDLLDIAGLHLKKRLKDPIVPLEAKLYRHPSGVVCCETKIWRKCCYQKTEKKSPVVNASTHTAVSLLKIPHLC